MINKGINFYKNTLQPALLAGNKAQAAMHGIPNAGLNGMNSEIQWRNARRGIEAVRDWETGAPLTNEQKEWNRALNGFRKPPSMQ